MDGMLTTAKDIVKEVAEKTIVHCCSAPSGPPDVNVMEDDHKLLENDREPGENGQQKRSIKGKGKKVRGNRRNRSQKRLKAGNFDLPDCDSDDPW